MEAPSIRVLLVEDSPDDEELILFELRRSFNVEHRRVDTREAMRAALTERSWDVILSDFAMPRFSGVAAFELLRECALDIPFIIVSGTLGEDTAVATMKSG